MWLIFAGGAVGSILRTALSDFSSNTSATLAINVLGAALLGFVHSSSIFHSESKQAFWATGFCGGFTTLSAIALMIRFQISWSVLGYAALTLVLGVAAYFAAVALGPKTSARTEG